MKQAKKIHIEFIKQDKVKPDVIQSDDEGWVLDNIHKIQQLCQQIISPKNHTYVDFSLQRTAPKERYDIMTLGNQFIDKEVLDMYFPMVKSGGTIVINPDHCWEKIDVYKGNYGENFRLKDQLKKKVSNSFQMIVDYANKLASLRSINLRIEG